MVVFDLACCFNYVSYQLQNGTSDFHKYLCTITKAAALTTNTAFVKDFYMFYWKIGQPTKEQHGNYLVLIFEINKVKIKWYQKHNLSKVQ